MGTDKAYLKCSAKEKVFPDGGRVLHIGMKVEDLIAFARQHGNARGYLNLSVRARRAVGQYGDTHSVALDPYEPPRRGWQGDQAAEAPRPSAPGAPAQGLYDDDVPF